MKTMGHQQKNQEQFDVVIVGGGLVGASLACVLKSYSVKIALIDKTEKDISQESILNARAIALSHTSQQFFLSIDLWQAFIPHIVPIVEVHVSKKGFFGVTKLNNNSKPIGYVISADILSKMINERLECKTVESSVTIYRPDEISNLKQINDNWHIELSSGKTLTSPLLIGSDGSDSFVRKCQGININSHDYQQTAITANIKLSQSHKNIAYERFTDSGPIAILPFGENCVKCVLVTSTVQAKKIMENEEYQFLNHCQSLFGYRLGKWLDCGKRSAYPLRSYYSEAIYGERMVLIGNAANTVHPVAAQGLNLGLRDVAFLAELIITAKNNKQDIGSSDLLQTYFKLRTLDHHRTRFFTHQLATQKTILLLGILGCEWIEPLKNKIIEGGMGKQPGLPKLCRGISMSGSHTF